MIAKGAWADMEAVVRGLPGCGDDLFGRLWADRGLTFDSSGLGADALDEYSARLVCANTVGRRNLFIGLPDDSPHRPALLFARALIRYWYDSRSSSADPGQVVYPPVLYFGPEVGIREQLSRVRVRSRNLNLADVFRQNNMGRRGSAVGRKHARVRTDGTLDLPRVFTVYSPADPVGILKRHRPKWVAIDCADAPDPRWLEPLLHAARKGGIWVVAWGHNPLSECVSLFRRHGDIFSWPGVPQAKHEDAPGRGAYSASRPEDLATIFSRGGIETAVRPVVLGGGAVDRFDGPLGEARRRLLRLSGRRLGSLGVGAVRVHWRCLNALATLPVPLDFYESEARHLWGLESIGKLLGACEAFSGACERGYGDLAHELSGVGVYLRDAARVLEEAETPMWGALSNLCIEEPEPGEARLITFPGGGRKQLFLLALLARWNITQEELAEISVWVASLGELRRWSRRSRFVGDPSENGLAGMPRPESAWRPSLAGLPALQVTPKLAPVLTRENVDVLIYPHQRGALVQRVSEWERRLTPDPALSARTLGRLGGPRPTVQTNAASPSSSEAMGVRVVVRDATELDVGNGRSVEQASVTRLWEPEEMSESLARLLDTAEEPDSGEPSLEQITGGTDGSPAEGADGEPEVWCETALEIRFVEGWHARFEPDARINVVASRAGRNGASFDRRFVRALRAGDRVLLIHGQRRQNLYDLIVSRIHRNPSIELHVALVKRWQNDFTVAYRRWNRDGDRDLEGLLTEMRRRGSDLTSPSTLRQWLWHGTLCPGDKEDLRRLAEVLDMNFVKERYRHIHRAASRLRGLHRGLSNRLNRWLEQQASGRVGESDDEVIDEELGVNFGDFRSSLQVLTVEGTTTIEGPFLRAALGTVGRNEE